MLLVWTCDSFLMSRVAVSHGNSVAWYEELSDSF